MRQGNVFVFLFFAVAQSIVRVSPFFRGPSGYSENDIPFVRWPSEYFEIERINNKSACGECVRNVAP